MGRIEKRCRDIFEQHPELRHRAAAFRAQRTYLLPEEGSWLSAPHMLPGLQFVEQAPEIFQLIRISSGFDDKEYIQCVCQRDFSFIEFSSNSKSGQFLFFTHDARCMVKTVSESEAKALINMLQNGYFEHIDAAEGSLLARIFGLYQVKLPWFNRGKPQHFIVQENVLHSASQSFSVCFDLKGSTVNRRSKPGEKVQKDMDWIDGGYSFGMADAGARLRRQHRRDCYFLAACRVIDYSLLIGISKPKERSGTMDSTIVKEGTGGSSASADGNCPGGRLSMLLSHRTAAQLWLTARKGVLGKGTHGPHEALDGRCCVLGIIDFLTPWSCGKRAEVAWKALKCRAKGASVCPPGHYADRQIKFVESEVLT